MQKIINTREEFYLKIQKESGFTNTHFFLDGENLTFLKFANNWITFENCIFDCNFLEFKNIKNSDQVLDFRDCTFNCEVSFSNCVLNKLSIKNTVAIKSLDIRNGLSDDSFFEIDTFHFSNDIKTINNINTLFYFRRVNFKKRFEFENIKHIAGKIQFFENTFGVVGSDKGQFSFYNSEIINSFFSHNLFNDFISFNTTTFKYDENFLKSTRAGYELTGFTKNVFNKSDFSSSIFHHKSVFYNCDFLSTTWFEKCKNIENTHLKFIACEFKGFVLYNHSTLNILDIDRCTYHKSVSFTDAEFNSIKLFEVKFGGGAYFDEMKINKVVDKSYLKDKKKILEWKRTLRAIKQELQKTENKIDFNRFRAYELEAHYEELDFNWQSGFKDKFILWATKWSTDFGNSWRRALGFTLLFGLLFFSIFFIFENYSYSFDFNNWQEFGKGYLRFFLVTDFYNPLAEDRTYIKSFWSWIPFIIGKIVIAFGIYEMIQSFRKFKA